MNILFSRFSTDLYCNFDYEESMSWKQVVEANSDREWIVLKIEDYNEFIKDVDVMRKTDIFGIPVTSNTTENDFIEILDKYEIDNANLIDLDVNFDDINTREIRLRVLCKPKQK